LAATGTKTPLPSRLARVRELIKQTGDLATLIRYFTLTAQTWRSSRDAAMVRSS
jgi:hypothetical protein